MGPSQPTRLALTFFLPRVLSSNPSYHSIAQAPVPIGASRLHQSFRSCAHSASTIRFDTTSVPAIHVTASWSTRLRQSHATGCFPKPCPVNARQHSTSMLEASSIPITKLSTRSQSLTLLQDGANTLMDGFLPRGMAQQEIILIRV